MDRTEEQKLFKDAITVVLGGEDYQVNPLTIKAAREWREKFAKMIGKLPEYAKATTDDLDKFGDAVTGLMVSLPDEVTDLFFMWAKDLEKEKIEENATDKELATALEQIMVVAFPLVASLTGAMDKMTPEA